MAKDKFDVTTSIIEYESGMLSQKDMLKLFQELVKSGDAWRLQGHYGRTAMALLKQGMIKAPKVKNPMNSVDYYGNQIKFPEKSELKNKVRKLKRK